MGIQGWKSNDHLLLMEDEMNVLFHALSYLGNLTDMSPGPLISEVGMVNPVEGLLWRMKDIIQVFSMVSTIQRQYANHLCFLFLLTALQVSPPNKCCL